MDFKKICYNCMKEKTDEGGVCPYCGYKNENYKCDSNHLPPLTPLNGKYLLGRVLGAGGFGITYIAFDLHLEVVVAIKELFLKKITLRDDNNAIVVNSKDKSLFEDNKKRFLQEARVLAMFNENDNEGIVIVKDHFEENNTAYIAMEYLKGQTLKEKVKKEKLSFEQIMNLLEPVCHALIKVHQFEVVHLDVSPDNIMIMDNNRAKLLDFGGAKTIGAKDNNQVIAYKRGYAPPEQYKESGRLGKWTDVYAVAATMYYCLTGIKPIDSMERETGVELEKPSKFGVKISTSSENALFKALDLCIDNRFATLEEFWNALNYKKKKVNKEAKHVETKKPAKGSKKGRMIAIIGAVSTVVFAVVLLFLLKQPSAKDDNGSERDLNDRSLNSEEILEIVEEQEEQKIEIGENISLTPGTYIFENASDRSIIMGIDSGFGDDGTSLILKNYENSNKNRIIVTSVPDEDAFFFLKACHTNSYIETSESTETGEVLRQFVDLYEAGTQKWYFVYCGYDNDTGMDEVIIRNSAGTVMAPKDGDVTVGNAIVLTDFDINDDTQKWYVRWNEKDNSEKPIVVYKEGDLVGDADGVYNIVSVYDGLISMNINRDTQYHAEPTTVLFRAEWLTTENTVFMFEFVPTGIESRYKIYPIDQLDGEKKCLEYDPDTKEIVMRDDTDNVNQLFRVVYVRSNTYLIQTYDGLMLGFDIREDGQAEGAAVVARPYDSIEDSRFETWFLKKPKVVED